jgi:chorismate-pyruvate lyase
MSDDRSQDSELSSQDYLFPLVIFDDVLWPSDSAATLLHASALPEPYRGLLAHTHHMTVTMEALYGSPVEVRVLDADRVEDFYHRRIVLTLQSTGRIVQYGLVRIDLSLCSPPVRTAILSQNTPLGRILIEHNVLRRIEPTAFLRVEPGPTLTQALRLAKPTSLYGRTGVIFCDDRPAIAVLEVPAPVDEASKEGERRLAEIRKGLPSVLSWEEANARLKANK